MADTLEVVVVVGVIGVAGYYLLKGTTKAVKATSDLTRTKAQADKNEDIGTSTETAEAYAKYDKSREEQCRKSARKRAQKDWDAKGAVERGALRAAFKKDNYINDREEKHYKDCMKQYSQV